LPLVLIPGVDVLIDIDRDRVLPGGMDPRTLCSDPLRARRGCLVQTGTDLEPAGPSGVADRAEGHPSRRRRWCRVRRCGQRIQSVTTLGHVSEDGATGEPDFWSFVDVAVDRARAELPDIDPDAMRLVLMLHRAVGMLVYDLEASVHRPRGLSWPGFRVLFVLWIQGPLESRRVAELTGMSRAAVSALVKTLERDGFLRRRQLEHDRRMVELSLTERGKVEIVGTFAAHNQREQVWAQGLSREEQETMFVLLGKIMARRSAAGLRHRS
jgi:DNA-binding MarR family transcriptional regulator